MGRVEGMADEDAPGMGGLSLNRGRQKGGGAAADDDVGADHFFQNAQGLPFDGQSFRHIFLDEAGCGESVVDCRREADTIRVGARGQTHPLQHRPGLSYIRAEVGLRPDRIYDQDIERLGQKVGRPARADGACADNRDKLNVIDGWACHGKILLWTGPVQAGRIRGDWHRGWP